MYLALLMINVFGRHIDTCVYDFLILISVFFHFQEHIEPPKKTSVVGEGCNNFRCKKFLFSIDYSRCICVNFLPMKRLERTLKRSKLVRVG